MKKVDADELEYLDELTVRLSGESFTGQAVEKDGEYSHYQTFTKGYALGPSYLVGGDGSLLEYANRIGNLAVGPYFTWRRDGELLEEGVLDFSDRSVRLLRKWGADGLLLHEEKNPPRDPSVDPVTGRRRFRLWRSVPPHPDAPGLDGYVEAVRLRDLDVGDRLTYRGSPYTGEAVSLEAGKVQMRTFVEGFEDGPFLAWSTSGKLITQGLTRSPYGPVGPWHEWDEEGRLLSETVFDALGNRIIVRELDGIGNIVTQRRFRPTRLVRDGDSGEERPAPWL